MIARKRRWGGRGGLRWERWIRIPITLLGLATVAFLMIKAIPGDEAQVAAGPDAGPEQVEQARVRLGLDKPLIWQYGQFLVRLATGDLGTSITTYQPVLKDIAHVMPATLELVLIAMGLNLAVALPLAIAASHGRGGALDAAGRMGAVIFGGLPVFWLALMLQFVLGSQLKLVPISGTASFGFAAPQITGMPLVDALLGGDLRAFADAAAHALLPAGVLALHFAAQTFRVLRAAMLGTFGSDFIAPLKAKGVGGARIVLRHVLPNSLAPVLLLVGTQVGEMIGSAVLVEAVFARQGIGAYLANAVIQKDTFSVVGTVLLIGVIICIVNLVVDLLQALVDPRIAAAGGGRRP